MGGGGRDYWPTRRGISPGAVDIIEVTERRFRAIVVREKWSKRVEDSCTSGETNEGRVEG
jgi:hypothetical protein